MRCAQIRHGLDAEQLRRGRKRKSESGLRDWTEAEDVQLLKVVWSGARGEDRCTPTRTASACRQRLYLYLYLYLLQLLRKHVDPQWLSLSTRATPRSGPLSSPSWRTSPSKPRWTRSEPRCAPPPTRRRTCKPTSRQTGAVQANGGRRRAARAGDDEGLSFRASSFVYVSSRQRLGLARARSPPSPDTLSRVTNARSAGRHPSHSSPCATKRRVSAFGQASAAKLTALTRSLSSRRKHHSYPTA